MKWVYEHFVENWSDDVNCQNYGNLSEHEEAIRNHIKTHFSVLKEAKIKDLLKSKTWIEQKTILLKAKQLQYAVGEEQYNDMNVFEDEIKAACKKQNVTLETKEKKQITTAVSWKNPDAKKVIKKIHNIKANPIYGLFEVNGKTIEYKSDGDLRDNENIKLDSSKSVNEINESYFAKEVQPHAPDAWIEATKKDDKDNEIGIVGYEIPFNRYFYVYQPPRDLVEIDKDLDDVSGEIMKLLQEVHS